MVEINGEEYFRFLDDGHYVTKIMNFTFNNANKIRSLNREMTNKLKSYGIEGKVIEIPNRVNLSIFNKRKNDFKLNNIIKFISIGRFVKEKNYLNLIKFLNEIDIDFHLTLIGGGVLKKEYERYIFENNLKDKVSLIDWVEQKNLIELVVNSDIYIQYSISEGMPRTILEAMAMQMPIISTNVGSILGVLENKKNSIVINPNSKKELKLAIETLIKDDKLREEIAKQAYQDVVEKYEWNKVFELYRNEIISMKYENT
jgi:glycosyltransferase involved in cell wall biosynthesis